MSSTARRRLNFGSQRNLLFSAGEYQLYVLLIFKTLLNALKKVEAKRKKTYRLEERGTVFVLL